MSARCLLFGLALIFALFTSPVAAQRAGALISQTEANRFGLERMWFTRIEFDRARARIVDMRQHVSSKYGYTVYEIVSERGRQVITDRDLDRFGEVLGEEGAKNKAEKQLQRLEQYGVKAELKVQTFPEITVYVTSDNGVVQAIDGESGRTRWTTRIGNPRYPAEAPGANDDFVGVVNGSKVFVLDQITGAIAWQRSTIGSPGAGPALTEAYLYLPMIDGTLEAYDLADHRLPPWVYQAHGRAMIQPVVGETTVAWPTDAGHLYVADGMNAEIRYRLETNKPIEAPAVPLPPNRYLVVSTDGYLYCIHENSGALRWRFSSGEPIMKPAIVRGDAIYIVTDSHNLYRLSAETGLEVWWVPRIDEVLSTTEDRIYCIADTGRLTILDAHSGGRLGSLSTETLDLRMVNHQTDRIFLGSRTGTVQCLRESTAEWPRVHYGGLEEEDEEEEAARPQPKPKAAPMPADDDPFGGDADDDPFGAGDAGGADDDPFGASDDDASVDDPFG